MEKYLKFSDVMEELDRLVRTKQIEIIHGDFENIEKHFEDMSIKSSIGFKGAIRITQRLKNEYDNILEHGHHNVNKLYIEAMLDVLDEIEDEFKDLKEENNPLDLQVMLTETNASCENCKHNMSGRYCKIHARYLNRMWAADIFKLKDLGCRQFEQYMSEGAT